MYLQKKPVDATDMASFVSFVSYYRSFIVNCAQRLKVLYDSINGKSKVSKLPEAKSA